MIVTTKRFQNILMGRSNAPSRKSYFRNGGGGTIMLCQQVAIFVSLFKEVLFSVVLRKAVEFCQVKVEFSLGCLQVDKDGIGRIRAICVRTVRH